MKLLDGMKKWISKQWKVEHIEAYMTKLGWECTCPGCSRMMHTNSLVTSFRETEMHWHYTCKCGFESAWHLYGPCPIYDPSYKEPVKCPVS